MRLIAGDMPHNATLLLLLMLNVGFEYASQADALKLGDSWVQNETIHLQTLQGIGDNVNNGTNRSGTQPKATAVPRARIVAQPTKALRSGSASDNHSQYGILCVFIIADDMAEVFKNKRRRDAFLCMVKVSSIDPRGKSPDEAANITLECLANAGKILGDGVAPGKGG